MKKIFISILFLVILIQTGCADNESVNKKLAAVSQHPTDYLQPDLNVLVSPANQEILVQHFLQHYYSVWQPKYITDPKDIAAIYHSLLSYYQHNPGLRENEAAFAKNDYVRLADQMNLKHFNQKPQPAMITHDTDVRQLPTVFPVFDSLTPGNFYPFDEMQVSRLSSGTPVQIIHKTRDKNWYLVQMPSYFGYVPAENVARIDKEFQEKWIAHEYLAPIQENIPIFSQHGNVLGKTRFGTLYPVIKKTGQKWEILFPYRKEDGTAAIVSGFMDVRAATTFPMKLNANNIANYAKKFIGSDYGWGDLYGLRDCSSTTKDIFSAFGVWLPRNSGDQFKHGKVYDLSHLNNKQKLQIIKEHAKPFFSLVHFPGHIALYIGNKNGEDYILHDFWGVHTKSLFGPDGRAIVGRTAITPLNLGSSFINSKSSFLSNATALRVLGSEEDLK